MPKPLRLFIRPPYNDPPGLWTQVYGYGVDQSVLPIESVTHDHALLRTTGAGQLFVAATGKLSMRPPGGGRLDAGEEIEPPTSDDALPATVNLYLHLSPFIGRDPRFRARAKSLNDIKAFVYLNVETASLETDLAELLDNVTFPPGGFTRSHVLRMFIQGVRDVYVTAGHALGKASTAGASAGSRQVGFTVLANNGPIDPSYSYDWMRDFVEDGQPVLDAFLEFAPGRWPVIDPTISTDEAIALTQNSLFVLPVLQELRNTRLLTAAQWRQVGNNQKKLWRDRLLQRVGHAPAGSTDPPFEFNDRDWKNIFQLEAVVELYANYTDPWLAGATPSNPGDAGFITVDLLDLKGTNATLTGAAGNVVMLDGNPDLSRVRRYFNTITDRPEFFDTILLVDDTVRNRGMYRITAVDNAAHTVTVDGNPQWAGGSSWLINLRPTLVIIDSFGGRLQGTTARVSATNRQVLLLDGLLVPSKVNSNFDTIYLPSDTARASRAYRIIGVNDAAHTVTVNGEPVLDGGSSRWHIQAGVSGELPTLVYNLGPGGARGFDQFDGIIFVVQDSKIHNSIRWSSYTSRSFPQNDPLLSSLRGNTLHEFSSYRSGNDFRNYSFRVVDPGSHYDGVRVARFYFSTPVTADEAPAGTDPNGGGKTEIRIHYSGFNNPNGGCNSAGCMVSPSFHNLRDQLINLYQVEFGEFNGPGLRDDEVNKAYGLTHAQSTRLWRDTENSALPAARRLMARDWNSRIVGTIWVIRPDERPLG